jgi:hypothetical protein
MAGRQMVVVVVRSGGYRLSYVGSSIWVVQNSGRAGGDLVVYPVGDFLADEGDTPVTKLYGLRKASLLAIPVEHSPAH